MCHWSWEEYKEAERHTWHNRDEIIRSRWAACYFCHSAYRSYRAWECTDGGNTIICPVCGVDSVLGDAYGLPIYEKDFMNHMHWYGFDHVFMNNGHGTCRYPRECEDCLEELDKLTTRDVRPEHKNMYKVIELQECHEDDNDKYMCMLGKTDKEKHITVRHRKDILTVDVGDMIMYKEHGVEGPITVDKLKALTQEWFEWPST